MLFLKTYITLCFFLDFIWFLIFSSFFPPPLRASVLRSFDLDLRLFNLFLFEVMQSVRDFDGREGFDNKSGGTVGQAAFNIFYGAFAADHDHKRLWIFALNALKHLNAINIGQLDVEKNQIWLVLIYFGEGIGAIAGVDKFEPFGF